jgi:biotin carboxyl carrier protein
LAGEGQEADVRTVAVCEVVGTLADLCVDNGYVVKKGEVIARLECMKVFYDVVAPDNGTVHFVRELGEVIGEGEMIAWITRGE